jgi:hypothetical protein
MTRPCDLTEEGQLDICKNSPPEGFTYLEPCCRDRQHKDKCLFWKQEQDSATHHGVHTYEIEGGVRPGLKAKALYFFDVDGPESTFEEVAALVQIYEWTQR